MPMNLTELPPLPSPVEWHHLGWQPTSTQQQQFQQLYEQVVYGNQHLNLTRITEPTEFWEKHLWDSLRGIRPWLTGEAQASALGDQPASPTIIDIGTGAGFPGIPVAIALPHAQVTLLDSTRKKMAFVDTLVQELGLQHVRTVCDRAEHVGQHPAHRATADLTLVRAVAAATVCAEYALPLLRVGGTAVLYRGQCNEEEIHALEQAVELLGGAIASIDAFTTPLSQSVRHCVYVQKIHPTPSEFPRPVGVAVGRSL